MQRRFPDGQRRLVVDLGAVLRRAERVPEARGKQHHLHARQHSGKAVQDVVVAECLADFDDILLQQEAEDPSLRETDEHDALEAQQFCQTAAHFHEIL